MEEPNTEGQEGREVRKEAAYTHHMHIATDAFMIKYCYRNMLVFQDGRT